jgi:hypothetical protein
MSSVGRKPKNVAVTPWSIGFRSGIVLGRGVDFYVFQGGCLGAFFNTSKTLKSILPSLQYAFSLWCR